MGFEQYHEPANELSAEVRPFARMITGMTGMDLEFLLRKKPEWREILQRILFTDGDIVSHGEEAEKGAG
ncbi:MAG: hypothetical protein ABI035_13630 [Gemmatimonadaceae bacterium]